MNTLTLYLIGRTIGRQAFKEGNVCIPTANNTLMHKMQNFSAPAQKHLTDGFLEGWREAEVDNSGW